MEENAADNLVTYITRIPVAEEASIAFIRHWKNLGVAFDGDTIWMKGFSQEQINSPSLRQIPYVELYEQKGGLLFKKGKLVPERKIPGGLLWNPVQRAFPVLPGDLNHNYFGIQQKLTMRIVPAPDEQAATALLTDKMIAKDYVTRSAAVRLQPLRWCLIGDKAFFSGTPLLSIPGVAYWEYQGNYLPAGYHFEFPTLAKHIYRRLSPGGESKILWFSDSSYLLLPVKNLVPLSVSSARLSIQ
ncbi:MAG: hypothetical protein JNM19_02755 [Chitinophagaceae bacterium]|nr:hypothetical protein [Chitinophagaceae bacterium]